MIKNILKSFSWLLLYVCAQLLATAMYVITNTANVFEMIDNEDAMIESILSGVENGSIPILLISALIMILIWLIYKKSKKQTVELDDVKPAKALYIVCIGVLLNIATTFILGVTMQFLPQEMIDSLYQATDGVIQGSSIWLTVLTTGVLVPIMEEITFRYGIHRTLSRINKTLALIVSSLIFGLMHGNPIQITYATVLGIIFAIIYNKTNNIWYPICAHAAINTYSVLITFAESTELFYLIGLVSIILIIVLRKSNSDVKWMFKNNKQSQEQKEFHVEQTFENSNQSN